MRQLSSLTYELPRYQENLKQKVIDLRDLGKSGVIDRVLTTVKEVTDEVERTPTSGLESTAGGESPERSQGGP